MPTLVYFTTGLRRTAAFSMRVLHILMNLGHDCGGGCRKKFTYSSSSPWVASTVATSTARTLLTFFVVGEELSLKPNHQPKPAVLRVRGL